MNTFMPYLENFIHTDDWAGDIDESIVFDNDAYSQTDETMLSADDIEANAYRYEIDMVLDDDDDFFIG